MPPTVQPPPGFRPGVPGPRPTTPAPQQAPVAPQAPAAVAEPPALQPFVPGAPKDTRISATVELPSKGIFYGSTCPDGIVELYPMTGQEEALVANMDPANIHEIFDILLRRCLKTPLDPDDMLSTDKFYLVLVLRSNSYGSFYEFRVRCQNCGLFALRGCNVPEDFEILNPKPGHGAEPFETTLPRSGDRVKFRLLRGRDDKDVLKWRDRELERGTQKFGDPAHVYQMAKHVVEINGKAPANIGETMRWYESLIAMDASALGNAIDEYVTGVNTELGVECQKCKVHFKADMPFTAGFFRTHTRRA